MGKPSHKGFRKSVTIREDVHGQGERARVGSEALQTLLRKDEEARNELLSIIEQDLKPRIEQIIKKVFIKFCAGHKVEGPKAEEEWKHFQKILRRHL